MSARDELAREIFIADNAGRPRQASLKDWEWFATTNIPDAYTRRYEAFADHLIAAGWTKPRTITTVAELLALHMAVVRTDAGSIANIVNERAYFFGYEASCPASTLALPVTVLWEPQP